MNKLYVCLLFLIFTTELSLTEQWPTMLQLDINGQDLKIPLHVGNDGTNPQPQVSSAKVDFSEPLYMTSENKQKLKNGYKLPLNITLTQEVAGNKNLRLIDEQKLDLESYFEASIDKNKIIVGVKTDIPFENLKKVNSIIFLLKLIVEGTEEESCHTVIVIFLDKPPETQKLTFEKPKYEMTAFTEYIGMIEQFVAKLEYNDMKSSITYNLLVTDEPLMSSLKINPQTGVLDIVKSLKPGVYNFKISAKVDDNLHAESDGAMTISHLAVCDSTNSKFQWSQLIKHFPEDKTGEVMNGLEPVDKDCVYEILWQKPEGDYFELNSKNGALTLKKEVKRDLDIFKDTKHPKFVIKMSLKCGSAQSDDDKTKKKDENQPSSADHYFDIPYNPNDLIVIVLIDKKESTSIFTTDKIFIGYPKDYGIITNYGISRITSVSDILQDKENNVEYSIEGENSPFSVNPHNGNVYPLNYYHKDEDYVFTLVAKDLSKKEEKLLVTVKILVPSQMVEIYFIDAMPENIDKLLQDQSSKMDIEIKALSYAVVPITDEERTLNKDLEKKQTHLLRVLCYALDGKDHTVVKGEDVVDKLKTSTNIFKMRVIKEEKIPHSEDQDGSDNSNSFVLKMTIVSVILALAVIITVLYLIVIRRRKTPILRLRESNPRNSVTPLEDDMEAPSQTRWIDSRANFYKKYDQRNSIAFPNPAFQSRAISYSNTNEEIVMMENRSETTTNEFLSSGVSSFKPNTMEDPSVENVTKNTVYRDLELPFGNGASSSNASNNVPVLQVTSLPPVSSERRRKPDGET